MKKLLFISLFTLSVYTYAQYISADEEYRTEGYGQGGNGNGNGGFGNGIGNGNAVTEAPIDDVIALIGFFLILSLIIRKYARRNS